MIAAGVIPLMKEHRMIFDEVHVVSRELNTTSQDAVQAAENVLNIKFPVGYEEYVTRMGKGVFSNWVRVYMPDRIVNEHADFKERWSEHYFWEKEKMPEVLESLILGDTLDGDELVYHPNLNEFVYLLTALFPASLMTYLRRLLNERN